MTTPTLKIGTRASPLALAQTQSVAAAFCAAHEGAEIEIVPVRTRGDRMDSQALSEIGGKGLFTEELETGLRDGTFDLAVHSLKDLPTAPADGLTLAAIPARADARDVLVARSDLPVATDGLEALPEGARLGTASLRRRAQILHLRPDLNVEILRGNVGTRLEKLGGDGPDATLLAAAGLARLGLTWEAAYVLPPDVMLPAAGQGALAVQCRLDDAPLIDRLAALDDADTSIAVAAERAFLAALDGSCRTPIAALAEVHGGKVSLTGRLLTPDGAGLFEASGIAPVEEAAGLGVRLADDVRAQSK